MLAPGMDRLLREVDIPVGRTAGGDVRIIKAGGGIHLSLAFQNILLAAHNNDGAVTLALARKAIERSHNNLFLRMRYLYQDAPEDGVDAFLRVILAQMVLRGVLIKDEEADVWRYGPAFLYDVPLVVLQGDNGHRVEVTIPKEMPTELSLEGQIDVVRQDIKALAQRLEPHGPGLRNVTREGMDEIKTSLFAHGLMPGYPILHDQYGRRLSGRHRMAVEKELKAAGQWDPDWPATWPDVEIEVADDLQAINIAMAGNYARHWTRDDFKRLEKEGLGSTKTETQRRLLELVFLEDHSRTPAEAAALVGSSVPTARKVRDQLAKIGKILSIDLKPGRKLDQELRDRVRAAWQAAPPDATQATIATTTGCSQRHAGTVRKELEAEGLLPPTQRTSKKSQPKKAKPKKAPVHDEAKVAAARALFAQGRHIGEVALSFGHASGAKAKDPNVEEAWHRLHPDPDREIAEHLRPLIMAGDDNPSRTPIRKLLHLAPNTKSYDPRMEAIRKRLVAERDATAPTTAMQATPPAATPEPAGNDHGAEQAAIQPAAPVPSEPPGGGDSGQGRGRERDGDVTRLLGVSCADLDVVQANEEAFALVLGTMTQTLSQVHGALTAEQTAVVSALRERAQRLRSLRLRHSQALETLIAVQDGLLPAIVPQEEA